MKIKILILILVTALVGASIADAKPRVRVVGMDKGFVPYYGGLTDDINAVTPTTDTLDANNINAQIWNKGIFDQDINTNNFPGFEWPKGTGKYAIFTAGLTIAARVQGELRMVAASYLGEWAPGYVLNGVATTDARFKLYSVEQGDNANNNPDYANWGDMVPFGAPFVDVNNNGTYDPGTDIPGVRDAGKTIFACLTDGFVDEHNSSEGFGGGTAPMMAEMHMTAWAYNIAGIEDMQFLRFQVINKNSLAWDSTFFGIVVDPDLGEATDDWIGCDTNLNMGYCYNSTNNDGTGTGITYGANPPASGMDFFRSPINTQTGDTLGMTSFVYFTNPGSGQTVCERDPDNPGESYRYLQGLKSDGTPFVVPSTVDPTNPPTVYCYPGDPVSGAGWTENDGRVENCGGALTGPELTTNPGGDRRFIFNSGSVQFQMNPNDTQTVVLAQFVARGSSNTNSVQQLKRLDETAQKLFDADFNVIPPPPTPNTTVSYEQLNSNGEVAINFAWQNNAESYSFWDTVFAAPQDSSVYKFQGYQVYEVRKSAQSLPDFYQPSSINDDLTLLAIFDLRDDVGVIQDSISLGFQQNDTLQYGYFQVVPPYSYSQPAGFPNSGLFRNFRVTKTNYPNEYNGHAELIYGQEYKYLIIAYGYSENAPRGLKANFSPLSSSVITVRPTAPLAGTQTSYNTGDTLYTNRRDLGLAPIILDANVLQEATYRMQYNADTTYNIMKSVDGGSTFSNLIQNVSLNSSTGFYNFDGIKFEVNRITKRGVIGDSVNFPQQNQSRLNGWTYEPSGNRFVEGSKYVRQADRPWQSRSMSVSWPTQTTFTGLPSLVGPTELRNIEIEFTGLGGAGQMAYRYLDTSTVGQDNWYLYQDFVEVPFRAYEVDPTDSTGQRRQINVAFVVSNDINPAPAGWELSADSLGGKLFTYFFRSDYNPNPDPFYTSKNLFLQQGQTDIYYVWSPKLVSPGATYTVGDRLTFYPYTITRPDVTPGYPLFYQFNVQPTIVSNEIAVSRGDMEKIRAVPNPYLGFNVLESSSANRFITFRRLPEACTIKIYTLNGDMIRQIDKNNTSSEQQWNLRTFEDVPVASGMYIALIDAPGIGQKIIKLAIFTGQERTDF
jgi:hypothetical protein